MGISRLKTRARGNLSRLKMGIRGKKSGKKGLSRTLHSSSESEDDDHELVMESLERLMGISRLKTRARGKKSGKKGLSRTLHSRFKIRISRLKTRARGNSSRLKMGISRLKTRARGKKSGKKGLSRTLHSSSESEDDDHEQSGKKGLSRTLHSSSESEDDDHELGMVLLERLMGISRLKTRARGKKSGEKGLSRTLHSSSESEDDDHEQSGKKGLSRTLHSSSESEDDDHELVMESPAKPLKVNTQQPSEGVKAPRPAFKEVYESTPWLLPEHKIFISHSGVQKSFAGQLCIDLQRFGYFPFYDECGYCLPKGEKFPELLFKAAHRSLLAILLLSEEFFTRSKWPMQELATFVRAQKSGHDIRILPVLLELSLDDLRNPAKWIKYWEKWANQDPRVIVHEWVDAVPALKAFNSIVRLPREGEVDLRNRIVTSVMETMPPDVRSSVLHVQGRERICKEVLAKFTAALPSRPVANVKVLGMFGIGGAGKSTVCKLITEFMRAEFSGRVCHVELKPETGVVKLQCMVLRELMRDSEVFIEKYITTEDKGRNRLEELMHRHKVFLALDNVSDTALSVDFAQFFLGLKFHEDSLIIVTSRSDQILCKQLGIPGSNCFHCPNLNVEEARDILLDKLNTPIECLNEVQKQILDETVERSFFGGYHPLALRLFAGQLGATIQLLGESVTWIFMRVQKKSIPCFLS